MRLPLDASSVLNQLVIATKRPQELWGDTERALEGSAHVRCVRETGRVRGLCQRYLTRDDGSCRTLQTQPGKVRP
jgi:hypothetical protein